MYIFTNNQIQHAIYEWITHFLMSLMPNGIQNFPGCVPRTQAWVNDDKRSFCFSTQMAEALSAVESIFRFRINKTIFGSLNIFFHSINNVLYSCKAACRLLYVIVTWIMLLIKTHQDIHCGNSNSQRFNFLTIRIEKKLFLTFLIPDLSHHGGLVVWRLN